MKTKFHRIVARLAAASAAVGAMTVQVLAAGNPVTGDNNMVGLMLGVAGVALLGMLVFFFTGKKKK